MSVEPVLCFVENDALRSVNDVLGYLVTPVSGQAVEEDRVLVSNAHELGGDTNLWGVHR